MLGAAADVITVPEAEFKWHALQDGTAFDGTVAVGRFSDFLETDPKFAYWQIRQTAPTPAPRRERNGAWGKGGRTMPTGKEWGPGVVRPPWARSSP